MHSHGRSAAGPRHGGGAAKSFKAHLRSLRDFELELAKQIDALKSTKASIRELAVHQMRLGNFVEARMLVERHAATVVQMETLLEGVREAIHFASEVTHTVEKSFGRADQAVADGLLPTTGVV
ncbi:MAG: hypothetical protein ACRCYU_15020 [Nocardioides sp.]